MRLRRGDIALVYFPYSDLSTIKQRPVLVVQANNLKTGLPQIVVAMISSNMRRANHPSRIPIVLGGSEAAGSGLRTDSVILTDTLATIEFSLISRRLGRLRDTQSVDDALRTTLGL